MRLRARHPVVVVPEVGELPSGSPPDTVTDFVHPSAYADLIDLHVPFDRAGPVAEDHVALIESTCQWLIGDAGMSEVAAPAGDFARRTVIRRLLTVRPARPIPPDAWQRLDALFADEASRRVTVTLDDVMAGAHAPTTVAGTTLQVWRGDITTLAVDAIVNAANSEMLGCFMPAHPCIDNAIHTAAGPRLREDCRRIMELQGHKEPTGTAKVTRAYYLPSRFVLHTVGPVVSTGTVSAENRLRLANCYEHCLDVAAAIGMKSVAFCAISTGVFGYPKAEAALVAKETVRAWLERHPRVLDAVIFNVFTTSDEGAYRA